MKKITSILPLALIGFGLSLAAQTPISEDFSAPAKLSIANAAAYLGGGTGTGDLYNNQFGTWVSHSFNGGIDVAGSGLEDGSTSDNRYSSIGLNRPTAFRSGNARATWVIFESVNFTDGVEYTVSFDVIGDPAGEPNGKYWLAELYGYDTSGANNIQGAGAFGGWGAGSGTPKPWTASGTATVFFLADASTNGVSLTGETGSGSTTVSFNFTYNGANGADIGFAVGTYNNAFGIDNFQIVEAPAPPPETVIQEENFSNPAKLSDGSASGYLGTGGVGIDYNGQFGTWVYHSLNGGIDQPGSGLEDGSNADNRYSSIGLNRPTAFRSGNARANWVVFESSDFTDGTEYAVTFDVIGDPLGKTNGRYWLAELSGYDTSGANYIQGAGAFGGWGAGAGTPKPWTASGSATVSYIKDAGSNGVLLSGDTFSGITKISFNFTYDGAGSPDIGFALGTFDNAFAIDNFKIVEFVPPPPVVPGPQNVNRPNFIIMLADDHRWDATGYIQDAILNGEIPGRIARFPWMSETTPALDTLASQGVLFQDSFAVASLCSPSRATLLTGLHAHKHGIIDNRNNFPPDLVTYPKLLQDNGYITGYFGKWHMGNQRDRPGFDKVATFLNQGDYFGSLFIDENNQNYPPDSTTWVDDRSTDFALQFIDEQVVEGQPFAAVIGFKTPHLRRVPPPRTANYYAGETLVPVPNLSAPPYRVTPPFDPIANRGRSNEFNLDYLRTIAGIDGGIQRVLDTLDQPGWEDVRANTVVIYLSDQGLHHNEHGLEDKRAPYEESIRIPLIIRYPNLQPDSEAASLITNKMALTLDLAPTILDLANLPIPEEMQGRSLKPLVENPMQPPVDWRSSFLFTYNFDTEFFGSVPEYIAIRNANGDKYVEYSQNSTWSPENEVFGVGGYFENVDFFEIKNQLFTGDDLFEVDNKIDNPDYAELLAELRRELSEKAKEEGFMRVDAVRSHEGFVSLDLDLGESILYSMESSSDLQNWTRISEFQGSGPRTRIDLIAEMPVQWDVAINSELSDYGVGPGNVVEEVDSEVILVGASVNLRNAVLVFNLPAPPHPGILPSHAQIQVAATRKQSKNDIDIYALGYTANATDTIPEYHTSTPGPNTVRLEDSFLDMSLLDTEGDAAFVFDTYYGSNLNSAFTSHLRDFYDANPNYDGEQYIHLRLSPSIHSVNPGTHYRIKMADGANGVDALPPEMRLKWEDLSESNPHDKMFFRVLPESRFYRQSFNPRRTE